MSSLSKSHDGARRSSATRQLVMPQGPTCRGVLLEEPAADTTARVLVGGEAMGPIPIDEGATRADRDDAVFVYFNSAGRADHARVQPTGRPDPS